MTTALVTVARLVTVQFTELVETEANLVRSIASLQASPSARWAVIRELENGEVTVSFETAEWGQHGVATFPANYDQGAGTMHMAMVAGLNWAEITR